MGDTEHEPRIQNSKNLKDFVVVQVLNSKLGITLRVLVTSVTILTAKRTIHKNT